MADEDKTITIRFKGDNKDVIDSSANISKALKALAYDTQDLNNKLKLDSSIDERAKTYTDIIENMNEQIRLAEQGQSYWNAEIDKFKSKKFLTDEELGYLVTSEKKAAEFAKTASKLKGELEGVKYASENLARLDISKGIETTGKKFKSLGDNINKVANAFKGVSLAAGAALTGATMAATNFETAMANVKKVLRTEDETYFSALQQQVLDMSRELPLTAEEIAQVTANALQLGVSAKDVGLFTETILKLGSSTDIAADEAAIALAQFFNITGESLRNVDKFGAVLTDLGNKFPTFESGIMDMATRIAAAGTSIGMSSQDILALSTALTSVGLSAEAGGSAISQILRTIDTQVATSGKKLSAWAKQAGMSVDEFKRAWRQDATGTFQLLVNSLAAGVDNGENLNAMLKDLGINALRQTDAFSRLVQANDTLNEALKESGTAWEEVAKGAEGALNEEFANRVNTLAAQFQLLKNDIFALGVAIGENLMPYLRAMVERAREMLDWFLNLSPTTKKWITAMLGGLAMIYPVLKTIGTRISSIGTLLLGVSGIVKSGLLPSDLGGAAFSGLVTSMKAFARSVAVPVAVIGALIRTFAHLYNTSTEFKMAIDSMTNSLQHGIIQKTQELKATLDEFVGWLGQKLQPFIDKMKTLYETFIKPTLQYLFTALTRLIYDVILTLYQWVVKIIKYLIDIAKPIIDVVINAINVLASALAPVVGIVIALLGAFVELVKWLWDKIKPAFDELITIVGNIFQAFSEVARLLLNIVLGALQAVADDFARLFGFLKDTGVVTSFKNAFEGVVTVIQNAVKWFTDLLDKLAIWKKENPSLGTIKSEYENRNGVRVGTSGVYNTTFNFNQSNKISGTTTNTAQKLADDVLSLVNNGIGKQLETRGW